MPHRPSGSTKAAARQLESMLREVSFGDLRKALERLLEEMESSERLDGARLEELIAKARLDEKERALLLYLMGLLSMRRRGKTSHSADPLAVATMARHVGLPATHTTAAAAGLLSKLALALAR